VQTCALLISRRHQGDAESQHITGNDQPGLGRCGVERFFQRGQDNVDFDHIENGQNRYGCGYGKRDPRRTGGTRVLDSHQARLTYRYTLKQISQMMTKGSKLWCWSSKLARVGRPRIMPNAAARSLLGSELLQRPKR